MPPDVVETGVAVWWLRYGWIMAGGLVLLLLASMTVRRWGVRALGVSLKPVEADEQLGQRDRAVDSSRGIRFANFQ